MCPSVEGHLSSLLFEIFKKSSGFSRVPLAFSILYYTALRSRAVCLISMSKHTLQVNSVSEKLPGGNRLKIVLHSHKHSIEPPQSVLLQAGVDCICPVKLFKKYSEVRLSTEGYVPIQFLGTLGTCPTSYNTHSFRIGKASDMIKVGCTDLQIKLTGRWHLQVLQHYT